MTGRFPSLDFPNYISICGWTLFICIFYKLVARSRGLSNLDLLFFLDSDISIGMVCSPIKKQTMSSLLCAVRSQWCPISKSIYLLRVAKWFKKFIFSGVGLNIFINKTSLFSVGTSSVPLLWLCVSLDSVPWKNKTFHFLMGYTG